MPGLFERFRIEAAFASAIGILLGAGYFSYHALMESRRSAGWVQHTYEVLDTLDQLSSAVAVVESSSRGFAITGNESYVAPLERAVQDIGAHLDHLRALTKDNRVQQAALPSVSARVERNLKSAVALVDIRRSKGLGAAVDALTAQGAEELQSLNAALAGMKEHERRLLRARQQTVERYDALTKYIVLIGTLLGLIITAGAGIGVIRDNQRRRRAEVALYVEKELAQVTLSSIGEGVIRADREGRITFFNRAAELMTGWTAGDALRQPFDTVFSRVDAVTHRPVTSRMQMVLNRGETLRLPDNSVLVRRDGIEIPIEDTVAPIRDLQGNITGAVKIFRDVSDARALTRRLEHSAQHDVLTGRSLLEDRAGQATALAARNAWRCALLFLDLDGFKPVNDRFGHATGDKLLQSVSQRLADCVRDCDTVSRLGGDEFAVLLGQAKDRDDASVTARRILRDVSRPYEIDGVSVHVTTSVGVSMYPEDGEAIDTLLKRADLAMYAAKSSGRNVFAFYGDPDLSAQVIDVGARRA